MKYRLLPLISLMLIVLFAGLVYAQEPPTNPEQPANRDDVIRRIGMLRLFKLTEILELSEEDAAHLFPVIQRYDRQFRTITEKKDRLMRELQTELRSENPGKKKLQKLVDEILALEREAMKLRNEQFKELKKILTAEQYAKYLLFDDQFRHDMNRMLDDIRRKRHRGRQQRRGQTPLPQ